MSDKIQSEQSRSTLATGSGLTRAEMRMVVQINMALSDQEVVEIIRKRDRKVLRLTRRIAAALIELSEWPHGVRKPLRLTSVVEAARRHISQNMQISNAPTGAEHK
jgi:uncharacterized protein YwbE